MGGQKRLIRNTVILFAGVIGTRLINFLMLPLFTSWLSVEEYGAIDIFTVIISMAVPILSLQLDQGVFRFMLDDKSEIETKTIVSSGFLFLCAVLIVTSILFSLLLILGKNTYCLFYVLAVDLQCIYVMLQQIVRGMGNNKVYSINSVVLALSNVVLSVLFIRFLLYGVNGYIFAFCISHVIAGVFMLISSRADKLIDWSAKSWDKTKSILCYSVPMIVNNISWWILNSSDKLVLNYFCGLNANGVFAAAGKIPGLMTTAYSVFHLAWQESAAVEKENKDAFYSDVFRNLFVFMSYVMIVLLCLGPVIFRIIIHKKFDEAYIHMPILLLASFFFCIAQFYGGIYVGMKNSKELGRTSAIAAGINLIVDFALVKSVQIFAASISTLVAYFALMVIRLLSTRKLCRIQYRTHEIFIVSGIIFASVVSALFRNIPLLIMVLVVSNIVYFFVFRDIVMDIISVVRNKVLKQV